MMVSHHAKSKIISAFLLALAVHLLLLALVLLWNNSKTEDIQSQGKHGVKAELWSNQAPEIQQLIRDQPEINTVKTTQQSLVKAEFAQQPAAKSNTADKSKAFDKAAEIALSEKKVQSEQSRRLADEAQQKIKQEQIIAQEKMQALKKKQEALAQEQQRQQIEQQKRLRMQHQEQEKKRTEERKKRELQLKQKALAEKAEKIAQEKERKREVQAQHQAQLNALRAQAQNSLGNQPQLLSETEGVNNAKIEGRGLSKDQNYAEKIRRHIRRHIVFSEQVSGNPTTIVVVQLTKAGMIAAQRIVQSSGVAAWDLAVERALKQSSPLPPDEAGQIPAQIKMTFRLKE